MNRLKLFVHDGALNEVRKCPAFMKEALPICEQLLHLIRRRWNIRCGLDGAAGRTDPILTSAELPRSRTISPHTLHKLCMDFPNEAKGQRKFLESLKPVFHGRDIVPDFPDIVIFSPILRVFHLIDQEIRQAGLRPLNP